LHTAKGLEFPVVFLTGMEDGVFPHLRSLGDTHDLEEERRLAYVGITRARQRLYLSRAVTRSSWGQPTSYPPSRFLEEVPLDLSRRMGTEAEYATWAGSGGAVGGRAERAAGWGGIPEDTPNAVRLAEWPGIDGSRLATASELRHV